MVTMEDIGNDISQYITWYLYFPQLKAGIEALNINRETGSKIGSDIGICAGSWLGFSFGLQALLLGCFCGVGWGCVGLPLGRVMLC
jgi:hypothetical protein